MQVSKIKSIIFVLILLTVAYSQTLSIGGVIRDDTGASVADGAVAMDFRLYIVESDGSAVWNESQSIDVVNGVYSHLLGSVNSLSGLNFNVSYWLGISIEGAAELTPRTKLTLSPYAIMAGMSGTTNVFPQDGNVGIGTTSPQATLDVNGNMLLTGGYRHFGLLGGNSHGYLYGNFPALGDGIHMGYNYYVNSNNEHVIPNPGGGTSRITMQYGNLDFATAGAGAGNPTSRMFINSEGNVGIGTTAPVSNLDINKPATAADTYASLKLGSNNYGYVIEGGLVQNHGGVLKFSRNNPGSIEEKVRFDANGNVGIGTTAPQAKLDVHGDVEIHGNIKLFGNLDIMNPYTGIRWGGQDGNSIKQEDNGSFIQFWSNGSSMIFYYNGNTFAHWSDRRLKRNFSNLNGALAQLSQLKPFSFDYQTDMMPKGILPGGTHYGVDAGEVQKVFPHLVKEVSHPENNEEKYLTVNYTEFVPILIQAVNEQENELATLRAQQQETVDKLIKRIEALEKQAGK